MPIVKQQRSSIQFHFAHPDAWNYPEGLGEEFTRMMIEVQEVPFFCEIQNGVLLWYNHLLWILSDNGGEMNLECINRDELPVSIGTADSTQSMPTTVHDYALLLAVRVLVALKGQPVDYTWRP